MGITSADKANSVVKAVEDACAWYGVPVLRMQSRTFTVVGKGGKSRPMFAGKWKDERGVAHTSGMADLLALPCFPVLKPGAVIECRDPKEANEVILALRGLAPRCIPLWIECKAGSGQMSIEQEAFKFFVEKAGCYFVEARDSADAVMEFFKQNGVKR